MGFGPGGGYDLSARAVGKHMSKYIPGNPTIVVENMTGAGSLVAANHTYHIAKPDGLFVGIWNSAYVLRQALGDKTVRFDARKLGWIGAPTKGIPFCAIMSHTGLTSLKDITAARRELKMGSTGPGSAYDEWDVTYVSGEEIEKYVDKVLSVSPTAKELLDFLMVTK